MDLERAGMWAVHQLEGQYGPQTRLTPFGLLEKSELLPSTPVTLCIYCCSDYRFVLLTAYSDLIIRLRSRATRLLQNHECPIGTTECIQTDCAEN